MSLPPFDQSVRDFERQFQVVLPDDVGKAAVGFRDGVWYRLNAGAPHQVPIRSAIILCPHAAGSIVQIICWWMRENTRAPRALDLATELALAVGELARKAIEDDPLGMSVTTIPEPPPAPVPAPGYAAAPSYDFGSGSGSFATAPASVPAQSGYNAPPPPPAPAPSYEPAYASAQPVGPNASMDAATTLMPQISDRGPAPSGGPLGPSGRPMAGVPRPAAPMPALPAALPPAPGRPAPMPPQPGFGGRPPMGSGRPPMGPSPMGPAPMGPAPAGQSGGWERRGPDPRDGRPGPGPNGMGPGPRPAAPYGGEREPYYRDEPRRPQGRGGDDYDQDYGRPQGRPRPEPGRAW